jgi:hypothetical protein
MLSCGCISVSYFHDFKYVEGYIKYHLLFIAYRRELYPVLLGIINPFQSNFSANRILPNSYLNRRV